MSDTPRTDAVVNSLPQNDRGEITLKGIRNLINCCAELERELSEATKQRDELANAMLLVWSHLKGERIRHDYITGTKEAGNLKTLQEVCENALAVVKGGAK